MFRQRRFYGFQTSDCLQIIAEVKTWSDVVQLCFDINESQTNLAYVEGFTFLPGVAWFCFARGHGPYHRHAFVSRKLFDKRPPQIGKHCDSFSVIEDPSSPQEPENFLSN